MRLQQEDVYPQNLNSGYGRQEMHCSTNQTAIFLTPGDVFSHGARQRVAKHHGEGKERNRTPENKARLQSDRDATQQSLHKTLLGQHVF